MTLRVVPLSLTAVLPPPPTICVAEAKTRLPLPPWLPSSVVSAPPDPQYGVPDAPEGRVREGDGVRGRGGAVCGGADPYCCCW